MTPEIVIRACEKELTVMNRKIAALEKKVLGNPLSAMFDLRLKIDKCIERKDFDLVDALLKEYKKHEKHAKWQTKNTVTGIDRLGEMKLERTRLSNWIHQERYLNKESRR